MWLQVLKSSHSNKHTHKKDLLACTRRKAQSVLFQVWLDFVRNLLPSFSLAFQCWLHSRAGSLPKGPFYKPQEMVENEQDWTLIGLPEVRGLCLNQILAREMYYYDWLVEWSTLIGQWDGVP